MTPQVSSPVHSLRLRLVKEMVSGYLDLLLVWLFVVCSILTVSVLLVFGQANSSVVKVERVLPFMACLLLLWLAFYGAKATGRITK